MMDARATAKYLVMAMDLSSVAGVDRAVNAVAQEIERLRAIGTMTVEEHNRIVGQTIVAMDAERVSFEQEIERLRKVLKEKQQEIKRLKNNRETRITTPCPSCHSTTLCVTDKGHLVCSLIGCRNPAMIHLMCRTQPVHTKERA